MIKKLRIACIVLLSSFIILFFYGKTKLEHLEYTEYSKSAKYGMEPADIAGSDLETIENIIDDNKVSGLEYLIEHSAYVLKIKLNSSNFKGSGFINTCSIKEVIKGEYLSVGDTIAIYDNQFFWHIFSAIYYEGSKPLKVDDEYIVFLNKAPNPTVKGSYMFASVKYGSFRISDTTYILKNYIGEEITLLQAQEYDYISSGDSVDEFENIHRQVYETFK